MNERLCTDSEIFAIAQYIVENHATVRSAGQHFGLGKSTIARYIHMILPSISRTLYEQCMQVFSINATERTMRGGLATQAKWRRIKAQQ